MLNKFISVYLDDIFLYFETQKKYIMHLTKVFKRIKNSKLRCKLKHCEFGKDYYKYLGHKGRYGTVQVDSSKTVAVSTWPNPTCIKKL